MKTAATVATIVAVVLAILTVSVAIAFAHGPYTDWLMPNGGKCCTDLQRECRPVRSYFDEDEGRFYIELNGRWVPVPPAAVLAKASPDGNSHACIGVNGQIYCFVNGHPKA